MVGRLTLLAFILLASARAVAGRAYVFSYFSDRPDGGRRGEAAGLHLAVSLDAKRWIPVNGDRPVLVPEVGKDRLMRDPAVCRGPDGTFHLVWTLGWTSDSIGYASSRDLVHWSQQREIRVMESVPETRNCWAPEVTYNPDDGLFYVYWSSSVAGQHSPIPEMDRKEAGLNHRIYLSTTKDFMDFSPPRLWFNPLFSTIDAFALRDPKSGEWLLFAKNENHTPVRKDIRVSFSHSLKDGFDEPEGAPLTGSYTEGPSALFVGDDLYLYFDKYRTHGFGALLSKDRGKTWTDVSGEMSFPAGMRHGTAIEVDSAIVDGLLYSLPMQAVEGEPAETVVPDISMLELKMSAEKLNGFGEVVRFTGEVGDMVRGAGSVQLVLDDWHGSLVASVPLGDGVKVPSTWGVGARLRVTGRLSFRYPECDEFRIAAAGESDVEVLRPPAWWTSSRAIAAIVVAALLILAVLGWALLLRHQKEAERKIGDAIQKERLRLSHDLHDGYQQLLAGCMFRLTAAMTLAEKLKGVAASPLWKKLDDQFGGLRTSLTHAQEELRAALWTMEGEAEGPAELGDLFRYAASRLPQWNGIVSFEVEGQAQPVSRRFAGALLMILQEAVGNALRHGGADRVVVRFVFGRKGFAMIVKDDGCGFDAASVGAGTDIHLGLQSMRSRAEKIGGRFAVRSVPGRGAEVKVVVEEK